MHGVGRFTGAFALATVVVLGGCGGTARSLLVVEVTEETPELLGIAIASLRLTAAGVSRTETGALPQKIGIYLPPGFDGEVTAAADGLDAGGVTVARGTAEPVQISPGQTRHVKVILRRLGSGATSDGGVIDPLDALPGKDAGVIGPSRDTGQTPPPRDAGDTDTGPPPPPRDASAKLDAAPDPVRMDAGTPPSAARFELSPASHDFGWTPMRHATADFPFTLKNTGLGPSGIPSIKLGNGTFPFKASQGQPPCTAPLPPGASCTILVHYIPYGGSNQGRVETEDLVVTGSPGGSAMAQVKGRSNLAEGLVLMPPHHDFGNLITNQDVAVSVMFTLKNLKTTAVGPLNFSFAAVGSGDFAFSLETADCTQRNGGSLPAGSSCNVVATYHPKGTGPGFHERYFSAYVYGGESATAHLQGRLTLP